MYDITKRDKTNKAYDYDQTPCHGEGMRRGQHEGTLLLQKLLDDRCEDLDRLTDGMGGGGGMASDVGSIGSYWQTVNCLMQLSLGAKGSRWRFQVERITW